MVCNQSILECHLQCAVRAWHLIGPSGVGKAQLTHLVEAIMRSFRDHDEIEYKKLVDWQRQVKTRSANKEKPERPDVSFWFPPADLTNPAFIQNAMALEKLGGRIQYYSCHFIEGVALVTTNGVPLIMDAKIAKLQIAFMFLRVWVMKSVKICLIFYITY